MNYRHSYHAGNFADVMKHCVLTRIVDYLQLKDTPFNYIDSHAGAGLYDLKSIAAHKTGEAAQGVQRLIDYVGEHPQSMHRYLQALAACKTDQQLNHYPGSPWLVYGMLREHDRMILNEYHAATAQELRHNFYAKDKVMIHQRDAYELLPAILPPQPARGVVLIDPPFESKAEHQQVKACLHKCLKRWAHGIYLVWYPVTTTARWDLHQLVPDFMQVNYLIAELTVATTVSQAKGLVGCNLLIINPPWKLHAALNELLPHLWEIFNIDGQGSSRVFK